MRTLKNFDKKVLVTFESKSSNYSCTFSKNSILIPAGSKILIPHTILPVSSSNNYYLDFYESGGVGIIERIIVGPGSDGYYATAPVCVYINNETRCRQEGEMLSINSNITIKVDCVIPSRYTSLSLDLDCQNASFFDADNQGRCGTLKTFIPSNDPVIIADIQWDRSSDCLDEIYISNTYGYNNEIVKIEPDEGYLVKGLYVTNDTSGITAEVNKNNPSYNIGGGGDRSYSISPILAEYHGYPYYGFDSCGDNSPNLWREGGFYSSSWPCGAQPSGWSTYFNDTISGLTGTTVSSMYGSSNEIIYVEGLDSGGSVEDAKFYCFMRYNMGGSTVYFVVDISNLTGNAAPDFDYNGRYSSSFTYNNKCNIGHYVMNQLMAGNGLRGVYPSSVSNYNFNTDASQNLYITDPTTYGYKFNFYNALKDYSNSTYGSLELI